MRPAQPIVDAGVPDQATLRTPTKVRDLDEFLEFLARLEALFGPVAAPRQLTTGERFLL